MIDENIDVLLAQSPETRYFLALYFWAGTLVMVYTDGSYRESTDIGGWAWTIPGGKANSGCEDETTSTRMELMAMLEAISSLKGELLIFTDQKDLQQCFFHGWWKDWETSGWIHPSGEPRENQDLWKPIIAQYKARKIQFKWISKKRRDPDLRRAHELANVARRQREAEVRLAVQSG